MKIDMYFHIIQLVFDLPYDILTPFNIYLYSGTSYPTYFPMFTKASITLFTKKDIEI